MGSIDGQVRDRSGAVLVGVTVEAVVAGRTVGRTTTADDGRYRLEVPGGTPVELRLRRDGFADHVVSMPAVRGAVTHDVTMQIGALSDTLIVTASRSVEGRARVTDAVSVMTAADIAALGSASLADVVRAVPGLNVESTGREGALASLFTRGGESDYNLVLIDGVRVNQSGGAFDFSRIAAGEIERVEIVRGAQSALYGSDAMGAVVQVFTKRASATDALQVAGALEGGSFNTWRGDVRVGGGARQRLDYHVGVAARHSDGAFGDILPEEDTFNQAALDAGLGLALGTRASLRTSLRSSTADGRSVGQVVYGVRDTGTTYDTRDMSWHLAVSHSLGSRVTGTGTVAYFRSRTLSEDGVSDPTFNLYAILSGRPGAIFPDSPRLVRLIDRPEFDALSLNSQGLPADQFLAYTFFGLSDFPFRSETRFRRPAFKYQADVVWGNGQRFSAGYEYEHETNPLVPVFEVHNNAVYLQQQFSAGDRWFATIGGRVDDKSRYGTFFSPKLSVGGLALPFQAGALSSIKVFANIGKGIKSPQFSELFGGSVFFDGNLSLMPERARTLDVGAELTFASERLRATVSRFDNRYSDLVEYRATGFIADGLPDFVNVAESVARGWEFEAALQRPLAGILASASYAFVDSEVTETVSTGVQFQPGQPLLRRPKHSGVLRAAYVTGPVTVNFNAEIRGERHDSSFLFLSAVPSGSADITVNPGYAVAGLGVDVRAHELVTIFLRGTNIADTRYESALGYPALPRAFILGARFTVGARR